MNPIIWALGFSAIVIYDNSLLLQRMPNCQSKTWLYNIPQASVSRWDYQVLLPTYDDDILLS